MANTTTDAVDFKHPQYTAHEAQVTLCNNVFNGIDTAKQYIVQRPLEDDKDYENRKSISVLNNYIERITTTMAGMIFRKPLSYQDITQGIQDSLNETHHIGDLAKELCINSIRDGIGYIMVDIPRSGGEPTFRLIPRQSLINWERGEDGFKWVVIAEHVAKVDGFKVEYVKQYRYIKEDGNVELYQEVKGKGLIIVESIDTSYSFCPVYDATIDDVPPLYDIANINIAHMNMESVLDNSTAIAMQPSLFAKGLGLDEGTDIKFGTNSTINTDNIEADVKWLELEGASIPYGVDNIQRKEKAMAERALQVQEESKNVKTATQVSQENSESTSRLSDISETIEITINQAVNAWHKMKFLSDIHGKVEISRDFKASPDSALVIGLTQSAIAGLISQKTYIEALNKAELVDVQDVDAEIKLTQSEMIAPIEPLGNPQRLN